MRKVFCAIIILCCIFIGCAPIISNFSQINTAVVDVEKPGLISFGLAHQLSAQMGARYFKIDDLKSDTLVEVLQENLLI